VSSEVSVVELDEILLFAFVVFWICWVAVKREQPLKWLIRFCEGPLMSFARYMDGITMKIAAFFVSLSRNPIAPILRKMEELREEKVVREARMKEGREEGALPAALKPEAEEVMRRKRAEMVARELPKLSLGACIFLILLFLALYMLLYLLSK